MKRSLLLSSLILITLLLHTGFRIDGVRASSPSIASAESDEQVIDLAICLDTSGSMEPLIDAARVTLWDIASEIARVEPTPRLRVALLTYGVKTAGRDGWVRMETDLTEDLDLVSDRLFTLKSEKGGVEYVGRVLQMAIERLDWSETSDAVKLILVAGNEPADQDPEVSFLDVSDAARSEGIFVHAIFYGDPAEVDATSWKELADQTEGGFASVDPRSATMSVKTKTPFDKELARLGAAINETYLPLGEEAKARREKVDRQDENARKLSPTTAARRAEAKAGRVYSSQWDLVDAIEAGRVDLYDIEEAELPDRLQGMSLEERGIYVGEMESKRQELRQRIGELSGKRRLYVSEQLRANGLDAARTLDVAVRQAIRGRLEENGLSLPER